ncbi:MAG: glycosyltransferase family 2 protein [Methylicorpusculum sp.]|uniref:glycosyltransferase family 2 protein n=1 Tax=Methylicorpusculum sp. TaxID=2713644 RepID=UPI0027277D9B|nr:glycosyltransferase family 2 protein [Methylicorpusculum sp.]MDO8941098.1 glycosyltransferase family 2 protein [Methylicorpusculum sp.]
MTTFSKGRVGIVLLNWNGLSDTEDCIRTLIDLDYNDYKIIIIDNGSDETPKVLLNTYPSLIIKENNCNLGFAAGCNIGVKVAKEQGCELVWILNNDTVVMPNSLTLLVQAIRQPNTVGVTNMILYHDDPSLVWFGSGVIEKGIPHHKCYFMKKSNCNANEETDFLSGCSFLVSTNQFLEIGGFDERLFCYLEDIELSLRIKRKGNIIFKKDAIVFHKVSKSTGGNDSPLKLYYKHRNMVHFLRWTNQPYYYRLNWILSSLRYVASLIIKHHKPKSALGLLRGLFAGLFRQYGKANF